MGVDVVDPELHEVVAGDIHPVAGRRKDRDAEVAPGSGGEYRDTQRAALGEEPQAPRRRQVVRQ